MASNSPRALLTNIGTATSRPWAFVIVGVYAVGWVIFDRASFDWHGFATLATWLMTLFIQRAEHRDTQALHAKLDELLVAVGPARDDLRSIDEAEPEDIEEHRRAEQRDL
jgi:low affinity Fe/Cu permease